MRNCSSTVPHLLFSIRYLLLYDNNNFNNNITDMAIYLKKFETQVAYEAAQSGLILPNVSLTVDNNTVHYNPSSPTPPTPSHDYVDLGLPSGAKWATMNVGASSITDYGNYYQYGKGADTYQTTSGQSDYSGTENPLAATADTATVEWGGQWHIPTQAQLNELTANTTYEWVTNYQGSGINGGTFTANGQTLFIPAAGYYFDGSLRNVGSNGDVWSSTPLGGRSAYYLFFYDGSKGVGNNGRSYGCSVRPVVG